MIPLLPTLQSLHILLQVKAKIITVTHRVLYNWPRVTFLISPTSHLFTHSTSPRWPLWSFFNTVDNLCIKFFHSHSSLCLKNSSSKYSFTWLALLTLGNVTSLRPFLTTIKLQLFPSNIPYILSLPYSYTYDHLMWDIYIYFTYIQKNINIDIDIVNPPYPWVSGLWIQPTQIQPLQFQPTED